ncbi:pectinesterase/pectinesterase inhibitor PPE8B [Trifolium repens]|nr:pectinesterase/pectinesterase inhibitor PPE8B [Trifolium repens]
MLIGDGIGATVISGSQSFKAGYKTFYTATFAVDAVGFIAYNISFENTAGPKKDMVVALRSDSDLSIFYQFDFIFGDSTVVFQKCHILVRQGKPEQNMNTITAQSRKYMNESTGFSFQFCNISADIGLKPTTQTYLGRPWDAYSRTIFMQSYMSAKLGSRVKWPGYHVLVESEARKFTVAELIEGDLWLPASDVTYTGGLSV